MKVAVVGKGGSGKTTTSAAVARALARQGRDVVALDCDTNANLGISLGVGLDTTEALVSMRERLDAGELDHAPAPTELLDRFGAAGPDGVRFAVVNRIQNANPGCPCCGLSPEQLLASFDAQDRIVIADLEAGIGTLTRVSPGAVDVAVIVAEPTTKSLEVADRALALAGQKGIRRTLVVANRLQDDEDLDRVRTRFRAETVLAVPDDPTIRRADRDGIAPTDLDAVSPALQALAAVARELDGYAPAAVPA